MSILPRRNKRRNATTEALSARIGQYQDGLWLRWQALPARDRLALSVLLLFLLLLGGGYGGYTVHQSAKANKANYQQQVSDYFWLRAQSGNINSEALAASSESGATDQPPASRMNALLNQSNIDNAQVVATGDAVQLSFSNSSQAVVSAALGKLEQQGWQFTQLSIEQDLSSKQIQVQAMVTF